MTHIRKRITVGRSQRDRHSKWAFGELRQFLTYKAKREGVALKVVQSYNTSGQCPKCHHVDRKNRKTRNDFECLKCHYTEMADYVAAVNIAARVAVNQPMVAPLFTLAASHPALADGS